MRWVQLLRKDLAMGPRSPIVLWALVLPVFITLLLRSVFGSLFDPQPRLGIVDEGNSAIPEAALQLEGFDIELLDDPATLVRMVEDHDLDAGLILQDGFDDAVRRGDQPTVQVSLSGQSLESTRLIVGATIGDLVRGLTDDVGVVEVELVVIGDEGLDLSLRLLPLMVIMAVAIAGTMVPAFSLVDEREHRTLDALLVTPLSASGVLIAKGVFGVALALLTGVVTLALNSAFGSAPVALLLALAVGAVMMAEIGLILGSWAKDSNTLFAAWKGGGILLFFPVIFTIWPDLPQWIAQLGPTYYFLQPVFDLSVAGASLGDVAGDLAIGAAICVALLPLVRWAGRRMEGSPSLGAAEAQPATPETV